jgi:hypothetical protein
MAEDIFGREIEFGGSFAADKARLTLGGLSEAISGGTSDEMTGFLVQNLNVQYSQQITKIYEVGGKRIYYVGGRTQGQITMTRVIGPKSISAEFYTKYGDICSIPTDGNGISFDLQGSDCGPDGNSGVGAKGTYTAQHCVITTVGFSVQAQDMLINEQVTLMIGSLEYEKK